MGRFKNIQKNCHRGKFSIRPSPSLMLLGSPSQMNAATPVRSSPVMFHSNTPRAEDIRRPTAVKSLIQKRSIFDDGGRVHVPSQYENLDILSAACFSKRQDELNALDAFKKDTTAVELDHENKLYRSRHGPPFIDVRQTFVECQYVKAYDDCQGKLFLCDVRGSQTKSYTRGSIRKVYTDKRKTVSLVFFTCKNVPDNIVMSTTEPMCTTCNGDFMSGKKCKKGVSLYTVKFKR
jgi:hypothetical protein